MSKVKIQGNASGTGTLTFAAPNTNTDRTIDIPDGDGEIVVASSGVLPALDGSNLTGISSYSDADALTLFNASGSAPVYACRAWAALNGTASPASIRNSGNVSSITDNGTGNYTLNFATALPDSTYATAGVGMRGSTTEPVVVATRSHTTTSVQVITGQGSFSAFDAFPLGIVVYI